VSSRASRGVDGSMICRPGVFQSIGLRADVVGEDHHIGHFAGDERTFQRLLAGCRGGAQRIGAQGVLAQ